MFLVITPVKNEADNLPVLIKTMLKQTLRPIMWLIVDDGSKDDTPRIMRRLCKKYQFVKYLRIDEDSRYNIERYSYVVNQGIRYIQSNQMKNVNYISIVDADVALSNNYFEEIIRTMERDKNIGVASGIMFELKNKKLVVCKNVWGDYAFGSAALVIRRECYNSVGSFPCTPAPDVVFIAKALKNGWKIKVVTTTKFVHRRSQDNYKRYMKMGEHDAVLGIQPLHAILIGLYLIYKKSYLGVAFMIGYFKMFFSLKRINDPEVFNYYRHKVFSDLIRRIKTKLYYT